MRRLPFTSPQDGVTDPFSLWRSKVKAIKQLHAFRLQTAPSLGNSGKVLQIFPKAIVSKTWPHEIILMFNQ